MLLTLSIYIDGFNVYFRLLEKRPALKRLNTKALGEGLLKPTNRLIEFLLSEK
jgi:hypothetical protein